MKDLRAIVVAPKDSDQPGVLSSTEDFHLASMLKGKGIAGRPHEVSQSWDRDNPVILIEGVDKDVVLVDPKNLEDL